ncbi:hypothetical protein SAMN02745174_01768 [Cetobacterium ceti]|uniref:YgjP-like metallopeptidase domain-containing protein n=1 Tax=Cetobacterium ceti TaxID=180163 RepID=A0A1T4P4U0_9FUSO|nr:SprT family zinc-dependent metalloprotease [Cetobacterium ceti]SJZ86469.1 hypothetical protein SAMN02745174_01768 [Cetobacterium ceti]
MGIKIIRKNMKNVYIKIDEKGDLIVSAPLNFSENKIYELLESRKKIIEEKLKKIKIKEYKDGDEIYFLGKKYILKIKEIPEKENKVEIGNDQIIFSMKDSNNLEKRKRIIKNWYMEEGQNIIIPLFEKYLKIIKKDINRVTIKDLKSKWGSCNPRTRNINLNMQIFSRPIEFVEYVIFHELTHLLYPHHQKEFYEFIEQYMCNYKEIIKIGKLNMYQI